jgi:hypothetical protein
MGAAETKLEMACRHVAEQEERIVRQEALIKRLRQIETPLLTDALRLLDEMWVFLLEMHSHVVRLRKP